MRMIALSIAAFLAAIPASAAEYRQPSDLFEYLAPCGNVSYVSECTSSRFRNGLDGLLWVSAHVSELADELANPSDELQRKAEQLTDLSQAEVWQHFNDYWAQMIAADQTLDEFRAEHLVESLLVYEVLAFTYMNMTTESVAEWVGYIEEGVVDTDYVFTREMVLDIHWQAWVQFRNLSQTAAGIWQALAVEPMVLAAMN